MANPTVHAALANTRKDEKAMRLRGGWLAVTGIALPCFVDCCSAPRSDGGPDPNKSVGVQEDRETIKTPAWFVDVSGIVVSDDGTTLRLNGVTYSEVPPTLGFNPYAGEEAGPYSRLVKHDSVTLDSWDHPKRGKIHARLDSSKSRLRVSVSGPSTDSSVIVDANGPIFRQSIVIMPDGTLGTTWKDGWRCAIFWQGDAWIAIWSEANSGLVSQKFRRFRVSDKVGNSDEFTAGRIVPLGED